MSDQDARRKAIEEASRLVRAGGVFSRATEASKVRAIPDACKDCNEYMCIWPDCLPSEDPR